MQVGALVEMLPQLGGLLQQLVDSEAQPTDWGACGIMETTPLVPGTRSVLTDPFSQKAMDGRGAIHPHRPTLFIRRSHGCC